MLPPIIELLPLAQQNRFKLAYSGKQRPIGWGEPDDIVVGMVQAWLNALDVPLPIRTKRDKEGNVIADGIFGSETYLAVKHFQDKNTLKGDGMVGHDTIDVIYEHLHEKFIKRRVSSPPQNASVTVKTRLFRCPPGTLICPEPPPQIVA